MFEKSPDYGKYLVVHLLSIWVAADGVLSLGPRTKPTPSAVESVFGHFPDDLERQINKIPDSTPK